MVLIIYECACITPPNCGLFPLTRIHGIGVIYNGYLLTTFPHLLLTLSFVSLLRIPFAFNNHHCFRGIHLLLLFLLQVQDEDFIFYFGSSDISVSARITYINLS